MAARDWSKEPYRKLLLLPSASFRSLSVLAQGLGYVLTREADPDGYLPFHPVFDEGLKRLWGLVKVPPRERPVVARYLKDLIADGMIRHEDDRLNVKNLVAINERRDVAKAGPPRPQRSADERSSEARPPLGEPPAAARRTVDEPPTDGRPTIDQQSKPTQPPEITTPPSRTRTRDQVGREVGRQATTREAPPDHPISRKLIAAGLLTDESPLGTAWGLIELARASGASDEVLDEVTDHALQATVRALASPRGIEAGKIGTYLLSTATSLFEPGALEIEQRKREARAPPAASADEAALRQAARMPTTGARNF